MQVIEGCCKDWQTTNQVASKEYFLTATSGSLFASVLVFAMLQLANAIVLNTFQKILFAHYLDVHYLAFI